MPFELLAVLFGIGAVAFLADAVRTWRDRREWRDHTVTAMQPVVRLLAGISCAVAASVWWMLAG